MIVSGWNYKSVEAHPFRLRFIRSTDMKTEVTGIFSKAAKIGVVKKEMCEKMGLNPDDVRMWDYHNDQKLKILEDPLNNLFEERILDNQKMLMEERLPNGKWAKLATKRDREFDQLCQLGNLVFALGPSHPAIHFLQTNQVRSLAHDHIRDPLQSEFLVYSHAHMNSKRHYP